MFTTQPQEKKSTRVKSIIGYTYPELYTGAEWYVGFYAFDPVRNEMRRKKLKINFVKKVSDRRKYGESLKRRIALKLESGWNPWIESEEGKAYTTFEEAIKHYQRYTEKLLRDNIYREDTYKSYMSYVKQLKEWNERRKAPAIYIYQFDGNLIADFLEYEYVEKDNAARTRDNYLGWIKSFCQFLLLHRYLKTNPAEGIHTLLKSEKRKKRKIIPAADVKTLHDYLQVKNKYFLLASYLLFYCFIRPKEMSMIRLSNFSIQRQTIFIPDTTSKNKTDGTITLPKKVIELMLDLGVFNFPNHYYLFSDKCMPGETFRNNKQFRDFWNNHVRKDLKFPDTYKFYSLKDTGITDLLRTVGTLSTRDQARHSSLLMTDIYTPHDLQEADDLIKNHDSFF